MEQGEDFGLGLGQEVDQQVPAGNEVEPRERRIGQHVMHRENDARAQLGRDPVAAIFPVKKRAKRSGETSASIEGG